MPATIGIRELKNQTSQVLRDVREQLTEYVVTLRGEPVAVLRPLTDEEARRLRQADLAGAMIEMKSLARDIAADWDVGLSGVELVAEQRR